MNRTPCAMLLSVIAALAAPALAHAEAGPTATPPPAPAAAPAASQPVATVPEAVTLLCNGTYYDPNVQDPVTRQRATQFTIKLSYAGSYMELKANEWPALQPAKDNPAVVRTAKFIYDDSSSCRAATTFAARCSRSDLPGLPATRTPLPSTARRAISAIPIRAAIAKRSRRRKKRISSEACAQRRRAVPVTCRAAIQPNTKRGPGIVTEEWCPELGILLV